MPLNTWLWESGKNWPGLVNFVPGEYTFKVVCAYWSEVVPATQVFRRVAAASTELAAKEARTRGADAAERDSDGTPKEPKPDAPPPPAPAPAPSSGSRRLLGLLGPLRGRRATKERRTDESDRYAGTCDLRKRRACSTTSSMCSCESFHG